MGPQEESKQIWCLRENVGIGQEGQLLWMEEGPWAPGEGRQNPVSPRLWAFSSAGLGLKACVCKGESPLSPGLTPTPAGRGVDDMEGMGQQYVGGQA